MHKYTEICSHMYELVCRVVMKQITKKKKRFQKKGKKFKLTCICLIIKKKKKNMYLSRLQMKFTFLSMTSVGEFQHLTIGEHSETMSFLCKKSCSIASKHKRMYFFWNWMIRSQLFELLALSGMLIDHNWTEILKRREQYRSSKHYI